MSTPLDAAIEELIAIEASVVARQLRSGAVAFDDLLQWGRLGALEARERFDPRQGVHFKVFAKLRVRGAIFDGLRTMGLLSRRTYARLRQQVVDEQILGDPQPEPTGGPTREDDARVVFDAILDMATSRLVAMEAEQPDVESAYAREDAIYKVRKAMKALPDDERRAVRAVYDFSDRGDSGARAAARAGVSRSQISRRHRKALQKLRRMMLLE